MLSWRTNEALATDFEPATAAKSVNCRGITGGILTYLYRITTAKKKKKKKKKKMDEDIHRDFLGQDSLLCPKNS